MTNGRAEKQGDGTLRIDLAPIAERYPQLASAESIMGMRGKLPAGPFEGSPALDELFSTGGHSATVAVDPGARTIVLSGLFE